MYEVAHVVMKVRKKPGRLNYIVDTAGHHEKEIWGHMMQYNIAIKNNMHIPDQYSSVGWALSQNKRSLVQFLVRTHAWIVV